MAMKPSDIVEREIHVALAMHLAATSSDDIGLAAGAISWKSISFEDEDEDEDKNQDEDEGEGYKEGNDNFGEADCCKE